MATFTIPSCADQFPVGTSVGAYLSRYRINGSSPSGSATATATVASNGSLAFTGLADDTEYVAYASVGGVHKYRSFQTSRPRYTGQEIVGPLSDGDAPVWSDSDDALVATPVAKTTEENTFTAAQEVALSSTVGAFAVRNTTADPPSDRVPFRSTLVVDKAAVGEGANENFVVYALNARLTGDFSSGVSPDPVDPGYAWCFDLFGHTGSGNTDGNGLTTAVGALLEFFVRSGSGATITNVQGASSQAAFMGAPAEATVTNMISHVILAPANVGGANGTAPNAYGLYVNSVTATGNIGTTLARSVFVAGGVSEIRGQLWAVAGTGLNPLVIKNNGGTTIATVTSSGDIWGGTLYTTNQYARLLESNSGGVLRLTKASSAPNAPGAGLGSLFLTDGTNAGTLKLCVRAGASGATTTILDNIPQS